MTHDDDNDDPTYSDHQKDTQFEPDIFLTNRLTDYLRTLSRNCQRFNTDRTGQTQLSMRTMNLGLSPLNVCTVTVMSASIRSRRSKTT